MPVLVTGATGFLGSRLARKLVARGESVRVLARPTSPRRRLDGVSVEWAIGDVTDRASVEAAMEGASAVYHVAALYQLGTRDPARMERINVGGTANVLDAAAARGLPAVYVSSVVALGPTGQMPADERHWNAADARSAYEATKRAAHEHARALAARGAPVRIALPVTLYGPDDPSLVGQLHRAWARGLLRVGALRDVKMTLCHVDDCAAGLLAIADRGADGREYILAGEVVDFGQWFDALARVSRSAPVRVWLPDWAVRASGRVAKLAPLGPLGRLLDEGLAMSSGVHWAFSAERARRELGFDPRPLDERLAETLAWYGGGGNHDRVSV